MLLDRDRIEQEKGKTIQDVLKSVKLSRTEIIGVSQRLKQLDRRVRKLEQAKGEQE